MLFYVSSDNDAIRCALYSSEGNFNCTTEEKHVVAADSRHLTVSSIRPSNDLLMVYEDPSGKVNIMHGSHNPPAEVAVFGWHNMTEELDTIIYQGSPGSYVKTTCGATDLILYCFIKKSEESEVDLWGINFSITPSGLKFRDGNCLTGCEK